MNATFIFIGYYSNTLESIPEAINGSLTACSGNRIEITCSHDEVDTGSTIWRISPPVNCSAVITHDRNPNTPPCGSIMFQDVTAAIPGTVVLSSTAAVVSANVSMSNSVIECRGGNEFRSVEVGNISLCIVGE